MPNPLPCLEHNGLASIVQAIRTARQFGKAVDMDFIEAHALAQIDYQLARTNGQDIQFQPPAARPQFLDRPGMIAEARRMLDSAKEDQMGDFKPTKAQALANLDDALRIAMDSGVKTSEAMLLLAVNWDAIALDYRRPAREQVAAQSVAAMLRHQAHHFSEGGM